MVLFTIITFGLYYPIWFLRRRVALNQLDSPRKLQRWPFVLLLATFAISIVSGLEPGGQATGGGSPADVLVGVVRLALAILMVWQAFYVKDILEDHLSSSDDGVLSRFASDSVSLSPLMTFFFGIYYLQHAINVRIVDRGESPATA